MRSWGVIGLEVVTAVLLMSRGIFPTINYLSKGKLRQSVSITVSGGF